MTAEEIRYPSPPPETLDAIRGNVEVVKTVLAKKLDVKLDLDAESIKWLAGYINRNRESFNKETKERLIDILGSFLGEAIIKNYGGQWAINEGALGVHLKGKSFAFPFAKVSKQMYNGPEDSIYSFYRIVPMVMDGSISEKKKE